MTVADWLRWKVVVERELKRRNLVRVRDKFIGVRIDPGQESADKVRRVLIRLLQRWMEALSQATPTRPVYLPFDFSDPYTGCLSCRPDGEFVEILPGTSSREGHNVAPSDPDDYFFGITDFRPDALSEPAATANK